MPGEHDGRASESPWIDTRYQAGKFNRVENLQVEDWSL